MPRVIAGWLHCPPITLTLSTELEDKILMPMDCTEEPAHEPMQVGWLNCQCMSTSGVLTINCVYIVPPLITD